MNLLVNYDVICLVLYFVKIITKYEQYVLSLDGEQVLRYMRQQTTTDVRGVFISKTKHIINNSEYLLSLVYNYN